MEEYKKYIIGIILGISFFVIMLLSYINNSFGKVVEAVVVVSILALIVFREEVMKFFYLVGLFRRKQEIEYLLQQLQEQDLLFNKEDFLQWTESVYILLQTLWNNCDIERLRILEDKMLFMSHKTQFERYKNDKQTYHVDILAIKDKDIENYREYDGYEYIDTVLIADIVEWVEDNTTEKLIRGSYKDVLTLEYKITFKRKKGVKTKETQEIETIICPSCGAPIEMSAAAKCDYCNTIINTSKHDWVISSYKWNIFDSHYLDEYNSI